MKYETFCKQLELLKNYTRWCTQLENMFKVIFEDNQLINMQFGLIKSLVDEFTAEGDMEEIVAELIYTWCYDCDFGENLTPMEKLCVENSLQIVTSVEQLYDTLVRV